MPSAVAVVTKAQIRADLAAADRLPGTTTSSGSSTTAIDSSTVGRQLDFYVGKFLLLTSGTYSGQWATISNFATATGTFTLVPAFGGTVASGVTYEVYSIRPDLYTTAVNQGVPKAFLSCWRPVEGHLIANDWQHDYVGVPRGMRDVLRVRSGCWRKIGDTINRGDSTTAPGGDWTATAGTWGVSSERLYSVSDTDADFVTQDPNLKDGYIRAVVRGTLNHASVVRLPDVCFRIREDYLGAIDTTTCLIVQLKNGFVDLRKNDAGTEASLTTATQTTTNGVDYVVEVLFQGPLIRIWIDGVELISYSLLGTDLKYMEFPRVGIRETKGGAPATAMRVGPYYAYMLTPLQDVTDWTQTPDRLAIHLNAISQRWVGLGDLFFVEGRQVLSSLAADTNAAGGAGQIVSDTTATLEITRGEPAYQVLLAYCLAEVCDLAADPAWNGNLETIPIYQQRAQQARASLAGMSGLVMSRGPMMAKHP